MDPRLRKDHRGRYLELDKEQLKMVDEVSTTVTTTSDGQVTISVEKYHQLLQDAAQKPPVVYRTVHRTPEVQAKDNKTLGITLMSIGAALFGVGVYRFKLGFDQMKGLVK